MFQRLKERGLRQVRKDLVTNGRRQRVIFVAGRRRDESKRRMLIPESEREGSVVWCSPIFDWTKADMIAYRQAHPDMPRNEVSDLIHMSGECLCGAFAGLNEIEQLEFFFPNVAAEIHALEDEVRATGKFPEYRCKWGWGGDPETLKNSRVPKRQLDRSKTGPLCDSCDGRFTISE